jgi:UDP-glucose 4-epimerase
MKDLIFITGASGLIGSELVNELLKKKYRVIGYDLCSAKNNIVDKNFKFLTGSVLDKNKILKSIGNSTTIIHLAAYLGVKKTEENNLTCLNINIEGTRNMLEIAVQKKIKKFIFASSSEIYGEQKFFPISEKAEPKFKSIYGTSKIVCEDYIKSYHQKYNLNYNILRFFNIYGSEQRDDFVISKFVKRLKNKKPLLIFGNGSQIRSFCHISDAIKGMLKVILHGKKNTIYNVGNNNQPISILNLSKKIIKLSGSKGKIKKIKFEESDRKKIREINKRIPDIKLLISHTGYKPSVSLESGIRQLLKKYKII